MVTSGLFVRARLPSDGVRVTRREHLWEEEAGGGARACALLPLFGLIYGPVKEEEIVFARAPPSVVWPRRFYDSRLLSARAE